MRITLLFIITLPLLFLSNYNAFAGENDGNPVFIPEKIIVSPVIDGRLDDAIWKTGPLSTENFIVYNPQTHENLSENTHIWAAYDEENLYFAFYCFDSEPDKIKTSIRKRDDILDDDWVGIGLDAIGNRQGLYELFVNPSGIQLDRLQSGNSGHGDLSVDWVWYSSAQLIEDGYTVEIRIPLKSLRYTSGDNVELGVLFYRKISRYGIEGSYPQIPIGQGRLNSTQTIMYKKLNNIQNAEILPSMTSGSIWDRENPDVWSTADTENDLGVTFKYGLTSLITAEGTLNPDFSQIESDALQIQANQRYPLFYSEKRPFFMESGNMFNVSGTGPNFRTTVHTRKIVDPQWGVKLTGEAGRTTFALLGAGDEYPGREYEDNQYVGKKANYMIGRAKYSIGGENYIGALYSSKELGNSFNRVGGGDFRFYFKDHHSLCGNTLFTFTNEASESSNTRGGAVSLRWDYRTQPFTATIFAEHYDKNFRMDTAHYRRTGISSIYCFLSRAYYPDPDKFLRMRRITLLTTGFYLKDNRTGLKDYNVNIGIVPTMKWNGWFRADFIMSGESWGGVTYQKKTYMFWCQNQITRWLNYWMRIRKGDSIYYDDINHFKGDYINWSNDITLQPTDNLNQNFSYTYEKLENPLTRNCQHEINILESRTTYQFNENFFIRALVQYDSYREVVLSDMLASFTLIPGTVMHLGYGSLNEKLEWQDNQWRDDSQYLKYFQTSQSLYFKMSYLFRH